MPHETTIKLEPRELVALLYNDLAQAAGLPGSVINKDGAWEFWEPGHNEGYTTIHRLATDQELGMLEAFATITTYFLSHTTPK